MGLILVFGASVLRGQVNRYDIIVTEIMANPLNGRGLPFVEYIELYNRSKKPINLKGFKIVNGKPRILRDKVIKPDSFLIIFGKKQGIDFGKNIDTLTLDTFNTLGNTKDDFYLTTPNDSVIDAIAYDRLDYQDSKKSQGGYSLERINLDAPCDFNNWVGSFDSNGGTPGKMNSVSKKSSDRAPKIDYFYYDNNSVFIEFDRAISSTTIINQFSISPLAFESFSFEGNTHYKIKLKFDKALNDKDTNQYKLILKSTLQNCVQLLPLGKDETLFVKKTKPILVNSKELIINEVLINPQIGGSRFIEFFNKSTEAVELKDLYISDSIVKKTIAIKDFVIFPNSYLVLADNPIDVQKRYKDSIHYRSYLKYKLPSWNEKEGKIYLLLNNKALDSLKYTNSFHNPLLANTEGVSLERINPNKPNDRSNWQSAAATVGYGTPGFRNSQYLEVTPSVLTASEEVFTIPKPTFSPDDDGFEDYLLLHYKSDKAGAFAKVFVFDVKGHLVKKWVDNEPLATEGDLKWDGETDEIIKAPIGIYIIYIELIIPTGEIQIFKKTISLTTRL